MNRPKHKRPSEQLIRDVRAWITEKLNAVELTFDEPTHVYTHGGVACKSVSSIMPTFAKPFNKDIVYDLVKNPDKTKYFGRDPEEILKEWDDYNTLRCDIGHVFHMLPEAIFTEDADMLINAMKSPLMPKEYVDGFWNFYKRYVATGILTPVFSEVRMLHTKWMLGGTFDQLFWYEGTGKGDPYRGLYIYDWKTNAKFDVWSMWNYDHAPLHRFSKTKITEYSFQTYFYKYMLEDQYGIPIKGCRIVWFSMDKDTTNFKTAMATGDHYAVFAPSVKYIKPFLIKILHQWKRKQEGRK